MEVFKLLPEGTLAEVIEGRLYVFKSPVTNHQRISGGILYQLHSVDESGLGTVIPRPFDTYLDEENNVVQPDILVVLNSNPAKLRPDGHFHGVPDFIIEILLEGDEEHDLITKKALYQKFGVKEYWIVNPDNKLAMGFALKDKTYQSIAEDVGLIKSPLLQASFTF